MPTISCSIVSLHLIVIICKSEVSVSSKVLVTIIFSKSSCPTVLLVPRRGDLRFLGVCLRMTSRPTKSHKIRYYSVRGRKYQRTNDHKARPSLRAR